MTLAFTVNNFWQEQNQPGMPAILIHQASSAFWTWKGM
jgi:hypothetical protein